MGRIVKIVYGRGTKYRKSFARADPHLLRASMRLSPSLAIALAAALILSATLALDSVAGEAGSSGRPPSSEPSAGPVAIATIALLLVTVMVVRGHDVRLVLLLGALPIFLGTQAMPLMIQKMVAEMANPATVVPIGAAVGFAFVLRATGCDRHLVEVLVIPIRRVRPLLVPGGIAAGYLINTTIVSQAGTASVLGPILLPLLRAGGLDPGRAGAVLLLGSSMGGELFNPGAVEMRKLADLTGLQGAELIRRSAGLNLLACSVALSTFCILTALRTRQEKSSPPDPPEAPDPPFRLNLFKAVVPILPLAILMGDSLLEGFSPIHGLTGPPRILAAILIGVLAAGAADPGSIRTIAPAFFEGAGYAYHHVISLIVAASTFAEGIRISGLIALAIRAISGWPGLAMVAAMVGPWCLAVIAGTGIAPAVAVMEFFVPAADRMGLDPVRLGTVASLSAHFGRTMSPAAAVVMLSSRLAGARPAELIRSVAPPLLAGGAAMILAALCRIL